jgi:hypothetical protein
MVNGTLVFEKLHSVPVEFMVVNLRLSPEQ